MPLNSDQFFTPVEREDDGVYSIKLITLEDTNGNGIPNYLDPSDTRNVYTKFSLVYFTKLTTEIGFDSSCNCNPQKKK